MAAIIVIPCYNEAPRLKIATFKAWPREAPPRQFLFVNDGSTDETPQLLDQLCLSDPGRFVVHHLPRNVGKGEAVRRGVLQAFSSNPMYVGYWDADLATPLDVIPTFCDLLDSRPELEMVFGARVRLLGRRIERSALRHYAGRVFATAASSVLGLPVYDTQCGAKLFRASRTVESLFQKPFITRWLFDVEILARLIQARRGTSLCQADDIVYESPLPEWRDVAGSKVTAAAFPKSLVGLARIYLRYLRP